HSTRAGWAAQAPPGRRRLQVRLRILRQRRARHAVELDRTTGVEALEALGHVGQARAGGRQVRRINLRQVTQAHYLRAFTGTGDDRLHLVRRQVLALVDQDQAFLETAPADVVERLELDIGALLDVLDRTGRVFIVQVQRLDIVIDGAEPRIHLFFLG